MRDNHSAYLDSHLISPNSSIRRQIIVSSPAFAQLCYSSVHRHFKRHPQYPASLSFSFRQSPAHPHASLTFSPPAQSSLSLSHLHHSVLTPFLPTSLPSTASTSTTTSSHKPNKRARTSPSASIDPSLFPDHQQPTIGLDNASINSSTIRERERNQLRVVAQG